jgi:hypothetical protein|tara:strand:+ start:1183 stop:1308 length:126 start_codon:yes stop_codon:yes gene_type:complete
VKKAMDGNKRQRMLLFFHREMSSIGTEHFVSAKPSNETQFM